ncbi:MAG TPA: cell division/cell wall cluster transcriptional repressor MraZ [Candidatus Dormibacteraeota bacterium]|jgi:MraZ protein|nr:cell division/cell wall cluster transcriptional repressor MraZ [Candidatus Dormibacteraeota bacterium]
MAFLGSYRHQIDGKGRIAVPAQFRRGLPPGSVIAHGLEARLVIRPPEEWAALERDYRLTAETPEEERKFLRTMYASAREVELDSQGRLLLDAGHRSWAHIKERAFFVGLGSSVEVIGEEVWDEEYASMDQKAFTTLSDRVTARAAAARAAGQPTA